MAEFRRSAGEQFLTKTLRAQISEGNTRFHTMATHNYYEVDFMSRDPYDHQVIVEQSVEINMRRADYEKLLELMGYFEEHHNFEGFTRDMQENLAFERKMRELHPGLQKAYNKYRTLLELVANGTPIED